MSKFETYIQDWRNTIAKDESLTPEDITELEDHLRADFLRLKEAGLENQEAFWLAEEHLGKADVLCNEYRKVNGAAIWTNRVRWMLIGYLTIISLGFVINSQLDKRGRPDQGSG